MRTCDWPVARRSAHAPADRPIRIERLPRHQFKRRSGSPSTVVMIGPLNFDPVFRPQPQLPPGGFPPALLTQFAPSMGSQPNRLLNPTLPYPLPHEIISRLLPMTNGPPTPQWPINGVPPSPVAPVLLPQSIPSPQKGSPFSPPLSASLDSSGESEFMLRVTYSVYSKTTCRTSSYFEPVIRFGYAMDIGFESPASYTPR